MVPAAVAPSRHHLPRGWFLKGDGFGGKGGMQPRASWNRSAPALQALRGVYALQRHPPPPILHGCNAPNVTPPSFDSNPTPIQASHPRGPSTASHRGAASPHLPPRRPPPRIPWESCVTEGTVRGPRTPRVGEEGVCHHGWERGGPASGWAGAKPRVAALRGCGALGGGEPVRSALGARQGSAHKRHSAPRPCLPPPP